MSSKPLWCRLGRHAYVSAHPVDEQLRGPAAKGCRRCGKRRGTAVDDLPPAVLS
ncbi:hypothetical protein [Modestobacter excelsi]|uniref:hypothetical protein n=1 Tax=Modestobacter excelsi TaxID=2213161 RepID=UPI001C20C9CF|nr:hypothetical protein [Modestobacter excelsi]